MEAEESERHRTLPTIRGGAKTSVREALQEAYPEPGTLIDGNYRVEEQIGQGAMGVVLKAHDERLDRPVAIKLIHPEQLMRSRARARFVDEARAMARVRHPNVVEVYAFGELEGVPYFVMEYVEGHDLERWLAKRGGPPSLGEAWNILDQCCRGVGAIHAAGHAHRDLKSSNILIGSDFRVAITDLGLARVVEEQEEQSFVSGTPAYMAPELIQGVRVPKELVPRVDLYSLGVIAFELLTGRLPFEAETVRETLTLQLEAPAPSLVARRGDIPPRFEQAVLSALEKNPEKRVPSATALREALESAWLAAREPAEELFFLVADDEPGFRSLIAKTLAKAFPEARVDSVPDGKKALAVCRSHPPSLLVSDLDMPELNGVELTAALRAEPATREVPIVVATAVGGPKDWRVLTQLGADGFMLKPFEAVQLISLAENLVGRSASWKPKKSRRR